MSIPLVKSVASSLLLLGVASTMGCRIEQAPSRMERAEVHQAKLADTQLPILPQPEVNDAERVMAACGRPDMEWTGPIYSKYYNGPVRRLLYREVRTKGDREVRLDFIPSRPKAELAYTEAPLPHEEDRNAALPANATWRFQAGQIEQEYIITAHRLRVYLPCAADALKYEF